MLVYMTPKVRCYCYEPCEEITILKFLLVETVRSNHIEIQQLSQFCSSPLHIKAFIVPMVLLFHWIAKHKGKYYKVYAGSKVAFVYLLQLLLSDNKLDTFTNGEMHGLPQHVAAKKIQDNPFNFKVRVRKGSYICGYHVDVL